MTWTPSGKGLALAATDTESYCIEAAGLLSDASVLFDQALSRYAWENTIEFGTDAKM